MANVVKNNQELEIKTRSIEQTLLPLIKQVRNILEFNYFKRFVSEIFTFFCHFLRQLVWKFF